MSPTDTNKKFIYTARTIYSQRDPTIAPARAKRPPSQKRNPTKIWLKKKFAYTYTLYLILFFYVYFIYAIFYYFFFLNICSGHFVLNIILHFCTKRRILNSRLKLLYFYIKKIFLSSILEPKNSQNSRSLNFDLNIYYDEFWTKTV